MQNVWGVAFYGQYTIGFLNSINVLGEGTFNTVCVLDRFSPLHSIIFSMPD